MKLFAVIWLNIIYNIMPIAGDVTFTNLKCGILDKDYADVRVCRIKAVNRTHKYIDIHIKIYQLPIDNVTVNLKLMRSDGQGYKVYFVDSTFDGCKFLRNQNKNPLLRIIYESYRKYSNLNHTCPYNHDLIIDKLWTTSLRGRYLDLLRYLPIANGEYAIFSEWSTYNVLRASINVYLNIKSN